MSKDFLYGLLVGLLPFVLQLFVKDIYTGLKNKLKQLFLREYRWQPKEPLLNTLAQKDINEIKADIRIDFKKKTMDSCNLVRGEGCFIQHLVKYLNTPKGEYKIYEGTEYGNELARDIFTEKNLVEFQRQCEILAKNIVECSYYKDYVEKIYSIYRKGKDLYIEMKLCGKPTTTICKIPYLI